MRAVTVDAEMLVDDRVRTEGLVTEVAPLGRAQQMFDELTRPGTDQLTVLLAPGL